MKLLSIILLGFVLTGCQTAVPVKAKFPQAPAELLQGCDVLQQLQPNPKLSEVAIVITNNYSLYHKCSSKVEAWHDWYQLQKFIYEDKR